MATVIVMSAYGNVDLALEAIKAGAYDYVSKPFKPDELKANAAVSCRVPPGQRRAVAAALCIDAAGVDLAGFLVAQGFALADPAQSYDYVGAETVARSQKRGLWRYR